MSTQHAPSPWGIGVASQDGITGFWQCNITRNGVAFIVVSGIDKEECEANARLVAAAPSLLSACKEAKRDLEPELREPGRTAFWRLVAALGKVGAA